MDACAPVNDEARINFQLYLSLAALHQVKSMLPSFDMD